MPEETKQTRAFAYCRVSTDRQKESGLSLRSQVESCIRWADYRGLDLGKDTTVNIGEGPFPSRERVVIDSASAYKNNFLDRQGGKALWGMLSPGDAIVVPKLDRGFRNVTDMLHVLKQCEVRGVSLHFLDLQIETSTPIGRMMSTIIAAIAEWESSRRGERVREAARQARVQNTASRLTGPPIAGFRYVKKRGTAYLEPDLRMRQFMSYVFEIYCLKPFPVLVADMVRDGLWLETLRGKKVRFNCHHSQEFLRVEWEMRLIEQELVDKGRVLTQNDYEEVAKIWLTRHQMSGRTRNSMCCTGANYRAGMKPVPAPVKYDDPPGLPENWRLVLSRLRANPAVGRSALRRPALKARPTT